MTEQDPKGGIPPSGVRDVSKGAGDMKNSTQDGANMNGTERNGVSTNNQNQNPTVKQSSERNSTGGEKDTQVSDHSSNQGDRGDHSTSNGSGPVATSKHTNANNPINAEHNQPQAVGSTTTETAASPPMGSTESRDQLTQQQSTRQDQQYQQAQSNESQQIGLPQNVETMSQHQEQQQQQTVIYQVPQIPSVVTLPVDTAPDCVSTLQIDVSQEPVPRKDLVIQQMPHLPLQSDDQIIGMVGAIPIIKMQGVDMPNVKKKKGRFNLLDETPVIPNVVGIVPAASNSSQPLGEASTNNAVVPPTSSSRSQSPLQGSTIGSSTGQIGPQTFDGISAPTVKRKGRFVVTNVKDPSSIIQIQTKPTAPVAAPAVTTSTAPPPVVTVVTAPVVDNNVDSAQQQQQQQQQQLDQQQSQQRHHHQQQQQIQNPPTSMHQMSPHQNRQIPHVHQTYHEPVYSHIPVQQVVLQPVSTIQQNTYAIQQPYQQNSSQYSMTISQDGRESYSQVPITHYQQQLPTQTVQYAQIPVTTQPQIQQQYVQYVPSVQQHRRELSNQSTFSSASEPKTVLVTHEHQLSHIPQYPPRVHQQTIDISNPATFTSPPQPQTVLVTQEHQLSHNQPHPIHVQQYVPNPNTVVQHQRQISSASLPANPPVTASQSVHNTPTPPTTPGGSSSSPLLTRPVASSSLPNVPIPKPPPSVSTNVEKTQLAKVNKKKTTIQGRSGKVPQSFDSNGAVSSIGLGKVCYLLEQMKTEVTDADQCIKRLQTDMKLLRDKNKELEAKNKDLDGRLREEQALREKAELRTKELRKKLREAKEGMKSGKQPARVVKEEKDASRNNLDSISDKFSNGATDAKPPTSGKTPQKALPSTKSIAVSTASPIRRTISSDAGVPATNGLSQNNTPKLTPLTPQTPKAKGSTANPKMYPPTMDLGQKESADVMNGSDASNRLNRPRNFVKETETKSVASTIENSAASNPIMEKPQTLHRKNESLATIASPPLVPPLRPNAGGAKATGQNGHRHSHSFHSLHDFDPLKSTVPVLSFPTTLSFENLPINHTTTVENSSLPHDMGSTHVSQNSLVVPLTIGMASNGVNNATEVSTEQHQSPMYDRQSFVSNEYHGLHQPQQYMVVPQQQPIVFNQMGGGMQQQMVDQAFSAQLRAGNSMSHQQYSGGAFHQQQRHQMQQHQSHHHYKQQQPQQPYTGNTANPFDPFSS